MLLDKDSVISILQSALDQMNALPDQSQPDVAALQAQIADLQKKSDDAQAALQAEVQKEADDASQLSALQAKIDAAKAALD